jgi:hypothetical protein
MHVRMPEPIREGGSKPDGQIPTAGGNGEPGKEAKPQAAASAETKAPVYHASLFPGQERTLAPGFVALVQQLEEALGMPVWLLIHSDDRKCGSVDETIVRAFYGARESMESGKPIALVIDSLGGYAKSAYRLATLLRRHCGGFVAVIPRCAKSAATLLALGAKDIYLGQYGELGPLDAQVFDPDSEESFSALDEVQTLERLHAFALEAVDKSMVLMVGRTGMKVQTLLPEMLAFVSQLVTPLLAGVDPVHYTQMSRVLKEAEEYATRLLRVTHKQDVAQGIARHLVERFPEHGFMIDHDEAKEIGLHVRALPKEVGPLLDRMVPFLPKLTAVGRLQEATEQ